MTQDGWETTTINSSLYAELNSFITLTRDKSKEEISAILKEKTADAYIRGDVDYSLLWLNEYQLLHNNDDAFSDEYESKVAPLYDKALAAAHRPCVFFNNEPQGNLSIEFFKNRYIGERCFIIGNGPSLNKTDLGKLKNEFTFGVNSIFLARDRMGFEPTFYCVEDTHVANDRKYEIQAVNSPLKIYGPYLKKTILPHPHNMFLNILLDFRRYAGFPYFSIDAARRVWVGGTVSYVNMQLAYYMGFKNVYLIGFDHDYTIPSSAIVSGCDIRSTAEDPNHFHPDYFGKGYNWHVPLVNRMELAYLKARRAFELTNGREIVNLTSGGRLEVFRRDDFEKVMGADHTPGQGPADVRHYVDKALKPWPGSGSGSAG